MKNVLLFFIFLLLFIYCTRPQEGLIFELSPQEVLELANTQNYYHPLYESTNFPGQAVEDFILVDLRSSAAFTKNHLPGAINIPVAHLLDPSSLEMLKVEESIVLYGEDLAQANGPWILLTQLGFDNIKMLEFGYKDIYGSGSAYSPEIARYDFAAIFQKATERHQKELEAGKPKPVVVRQKKVIVPKRKKIQEEVEEEGC